MAEWWVRLIHRANSAPVGEYSLGQPEVEIRNSEPGGFSGELALSQTRRGSDVLGITRDQFAPYSANFELWRGSALITDGMLTSANLNFNRDTVLIAGKDWKHYLQRRIYPFTPEDYITYNAQAKHSFFDQWPKKWPKKALPDDPEAPAVPIKRIVRDILVSMRTGVPVDFSTPAAERQALPAAPGTPNIVWNIDPTGGPTARYKIYPGDQTTIYDHIQKLSELSEGFEWDITPLGREFRMWIPKKFTSNVPVYHWRATDDETLGSFTEFDWTNDGPEGTYLLGLGSGRHKIGATWTYRPSVDLYGRLDLVYDYGEMQDYATILSKLKDQNDLHPQKKLSVALLNPEFLGLNFYTGGRPRELIGNTIRVTHDFLPYHLVDAYFSVNSIKWSVDYSTNETVNLELMMIYEPETGQSGGLGPFQGGV